MRLPVKVRSLPPNTAMNAVVQNMPANWATLKINGEIIVKFYNEETVETIMVADVIRPLIPVICCIKGSSNPRI